MAGSRTTGDKPEFNSEQAEQLARELGLPDIDIAKEIKNPVIFLAYVMAHIRKQRAEDDTSMYEMTKLPDSIQTLVDSQNFNEQAEFLITQLNQKLANPTYPTIDQRIAIELVASSKENEKSIDITSIINRFGVNHFENIVALAVLFEGSAMLAKAQTMTKHLPHSPDFEPPLPTPPAVTDPGDPEDTALAPPVPTSPRAAEASEEADDDDIEENLPPLPLTPKQLKKAEKKMVAAEAAFKEIVETERGSKRDKLIKKKIDEGHKAFLIKAATAYSDQGKANEVLSEIIASIRDNPKRKIEHNYKYYQAVTDVATGPPVNFSAIKHVTSMLRDPSFTDETKKIAMIRPLLQALLNHAESIASNTESAFEKIFTHLSEDNKKIAVDKIKSVISGVKDALKKENTTIYNDDVNSILSTLSEPNIFSMEDYVIRTCCIDAKFRDAAGLKGGSTYTSLSEAAAAASAAPAVVVQPADPRLAPINELMETERAFLENIKLFISDDNISKIKKIISSIKDTNEQKLYSDKLESYLKPLRELANSNSDPLAAHRREDWKHDGWTDAEEASKDLLNKISTPAFLKHIQLMQISANQYDEFLAFLKSSKLDIELDRGLYVHDYIIMPSQRISRYPMTIEAHDKHLQESTGSISSKIEARTALHIAKSHAALINAEKDLSGEINALLDTLLKPKTLNAIFGNSPPNQTPQDAIKALDYLCGAIQSEKASGFFASIRKATTRPVIDKACYPRLLALSATLYDSGYINLAQLDKYANVFAVISPPAERPQLKNIISDLLGTDTPHLPACIQEFPIEASLGSLNNILQLLAKEHIVQQRAGQVDNAADIVTLMEALVKVQLRNKFVLLLTDGKIKTDEETAYFKAYCNQLEPHELEQFRSKLPTDINALPAPDTIKNYLKEQFGMLDELRKIEAENVVLNKVFGGDGALATIRAELPTLEATIAGLKKPAPVVGPSSGGMFAVVPKPADAPKPAEPDARPSSPGPSPAGDGSES